MLPVLETLGVISVVTVGLLVMVPAVRFEQLGRGLGRSFLVVFLALIFAVISKALLLPILFCGLVWSEHALAWALVIVLLIIASTLLSQALVRLARIHRRRRNREHTERTERF